MITYRISGDEFTIIPTNTTIFPGSRYFSKQKKNPQRGYTEVYLAVHLA